MRQKYTAKDSGGSLFDAVLTQVNADAVLGNAHIGALPTQHAQC